MRALAIIYQHPSMQFFGGAQLNKKTVLRCSFNYSHIVHCCNIADFCSFILIQDVWGVKLKCLLDRRLVLRQPQYMIYRKTALLNSWAAMVLQVGRQCSVINKIFFCEKIWITKAWNVLWRLTCSRASTHFLDWFCFIFRFIFSSSKKLIQFFWKTLVFG